VPVAGLNPDHHDHCLAGRPDHRRSCGKLPDSARNSRFHAPTPGPCPDRQVIVLGTTPDPAPLSVAPRRATDYYLSVGTPAPESVGITPSLRGAHTFVSFLGTLADFGSEAPRID
jgi:hypothetical protein